MSYTGRNGKKDIRDRLAANEALDAQQDDRLDALEQNGGNSGLTLEQVNAAIAAYLLANPQGGGAFPIWAEKGGPLLSNSYEWSWGNGATGSAIGVVIGVDCELVSVSLNAENFGTSVQVITQVNGAPVNTATFLSNDGVQQLATPVPVPVGSRISFRTGALVGNTSDAHVCAWLRAT